MIELLINQSINKNSTSCRVLLHGLEPPGAAIADHGILPEGLFSRVLASHPGGLGSIPGRAMSVQGPLV
jgi:hypothetical protein